MSNLKREYETLDEFMNDLKVWREDYWKTQWTHTLSYINSDNLMNNAQVIPHQRGM